MTEEYFPSVQVLPKDQRRIWLLEHYWFDCKCDACEVDQESLKTISTKYSKFCCQNGKCTATIEDGDYEDSVCQTCNNTVNIQDSKVEIEKLKEEIEMIRAGLENIDNLHDNKENLKKITSVWIR